MGHDGETSIDARRTCRCLATTLATVLIALLAAPEALAQRWVDQRHVGPFVVQATFSLRPYEPVLAELTELEQELRRVLALGPCEAPIALLLLKDEQEHRECLARRFPGAPYRRALFVKQDGRSTVFAYRHEELAIDLRHECTHALLHADLANLPLWLDEGLAEYFEMPASERAFGNPHADALRPPLRIGYVRGLESLEAKQELADLSSQDYQFAWAWTHFLLHGPKPATQQLWAFIGALRRGEPAGSMSERIGALVAEPNQQLVQHFRKWSRLETARATERSGRQVR